MSGNSFSSSSNRVLRDGWKDPKKQRAFFEKLSKTLGIKKWEDWYRVTFNDIKNQGGSGIITHFGSHTKALASVFPEYKWEFWRFERVGNNVWKNPNNQRFFLDSFAEKILSVKTKGDFEKWYSVERQEIESFGGFTLLKLYDNSLPKLLQSVYPEYSWQEWKFKQLEQGYWKNSKNQSFFISQMAKILNISDSNWEEWYNISENFILENGGEGLLQLFGYSLANALIQIQPQYPWIIHKFKSAREKQRILFEKIAKTLEIKEMEEWYSIKRTTILELGGANILHNYGGSFSRAIMATFPEYSWEPWKFEKVHQGFWEEKDNVRLFMEWAAKKLDIKDPSDWHKISGNQIQGIGGATLIAKYGGLAAVLPIAFPNFEWETSLSHAGKLSLSQTHIKSQRLLFEKVQILFPRLDVLFNHSLLPTANPLQLDIFVPDLKLAFEYQGKQHFNDHQMFGLTDQLKERDKIKQNVCNQSNITLICVPYWYELSLESIKSLIVKVRPDIQFSENNLQHTKK